MFCFNCGRKLPDDALFCAFCGTKMEEEEEVVKEEVPAVQEPPVDPKSPVTPVAPYAPEPKVVEDVPTLVTPAPPVPQPQAPVYSQPVSQPINPNFASYGNIYMDPVPAQKKPRLYKPNILAIIAVAAFVAGMFLPYVSFLGVSENFIELWKELDITYFFIMAFCAAGVGLVFAIADIEIFVALAGIAAVVVDVITYLKFNDELGGGSLGVTIMNFASVGLYMMYAGAAVLLIAGICGIIGKGRRRKARKSYNSMMGM